MKVHLAISLSHRFECLNVLLDVFKNNFKNEYITHVFCNLNEDNLKQHKEKLDFSLIDYFHHFPDDCSMKQNTYETEKSREKYKRVQPLRLIKNVFSTMSLKDDVEKFIYTECDGYPLVEDKYVNYLNFVSNDSLLAAYTKRYNAKHPEGFLFPSPIYLAKIHAQKIANVIVEPILPNSYSFEGRLMTAFKLANVPLKQIDENFPNASISHKNIFRATESTHQHNILNLKNIFKEYGIINGKWINQVLNNDEIYELHSDSKMKFDPSFKLSYWDSK